MPEGLLGRIGFDVWRSNPNVLYAQMEVGASTGTGGEEQTSGQRPTPDSDAVAQRDHPSWLTHSRIQRDRVCGAQTIKAKRWRIVSNENNRPMYYSQIRVDPSNPENVYVGGLNFSKSTDGGKTFVSLQANIAHVDNHAIWIDPKNGNHIARRQRRRAERQLRSRRNWEFINTIAAAQFYAIGVDMRKPYYVYGGLQDNGSWGGPSQTRNPRGHHERRLVSRRRRRRILHAWRSD